MTIGQFQDFQTDLSKYSDERGANATWATGRCWLLQHFYDELFHDFEVSHLDFDKRAEWLKTHSKEQIPQSCLLIVSLFFYHLLGGIASPEATHEPLNEVERANLQRIIDSIDTELKKMTEIQDIQPII